MSESKEPPRLPEVVDEAGNSPSWLPWVGFAVIGLLAFVLIGRQAMDSARGAAKSAAPQEAAAPAAAGAPSE